MPIRPRLLSSPLLVVHGQEPDSGAGGGLHDVGSGIGSGGGETTDLAVLARRHRGVQFPVHQINLALQTKELEILGGLARSKGALADDEFLSEKIGEGFHTGSIAYHLMHGERRNRKQGPDLVKGRIFRGERFLTGNSELDQRRWRREDIVAFAIRRLLHVMHRPLALLDDDDDVAVPDS